MTMELGGRVTVECEKNNLQAELEFKLKVVLAAAPSAHLRALEGRGGAGLGGPSHPLHSPGMVSWAGAHWESSSWQSVVQPEPREGQGPHSRVRTGPGPFPTRGHGVGLVGTLHPWARTETSGGRGHWKLRGLSCQPPGHWGLGAAPPRGRSLLLLPCSLGVPGSMEQLPALTATLLGVSPQPFFGGTMNINQVSGKIASGEEVLARLTGHWVRGCPWKCRLSPGRGVAVGLAPLTPPGPSGAGQGGVYQGGGQRKHRALLEPEWGGPRAEAEAAHGAVQGADRAGVREVSPPGTHQTLLSHLGVAGWAAASQVGTVTLL